MQFLKNKRTEMGLSQREVSYLCGIKQGYYSQIENGVRRPSVELAKKLSEILHFEWVEFFS